MAPNYVDGVAEEVCLASPHLLSALQHHVTQVAGEVLQKMLQSRKDLLVGLTNLPTGDTGVQVRRDEIIVATKAACQCHVGGTTKDGDD